MRENEFENHPTVKALNELIDRLRFERECGVKSVQIDSEVWRQFITKKTVPQAKNEPVIQKNTRLEEPQINLKIVAVSGVVFPEDAMKKQVLSDASHLLFGKMLEAIKLSLKDDVRLIGITEQKFIPTAENEEICANAKELAIRVKELKPQVVLLLGPKAVKALLVAKTGICNTIGQWHEWEGIRAVAIHHPGRILMVDEETAKPLKREVWTILKMVKDWFDNGKI